MNTKSGLALLACKHFLRSHITPATSLVSFTFEFRYQPGLELVAPENWVLLEDLTNSTIGALRAAIGELHPEAEACIRSEEVRPPSYYLEYYDAELFGLVEKADALIFERFGYSSFDQLRGKNPTWFKPGEAPPLQNQG